MRRISRRTFNGMLGATAAAALAAPAIAAGKKPRVVIIGGGFGGATAARYLTRFDATIEVTLIEPNKKFTTCAFSNSVIGGLVDLDFITQNYTAHIKRGVKVIHEMATVIDGDKKQVRLQGGGIVVFDRCIVSPGIDFKWSAVEGLDPAIQSKIPHAWKAGSQTILLRRQLEEMPDGGTFLFSPPPNPSRCPPGAGERISLIANYFKQHKPRSKIVVLDPKEKFSKQELFIEAWAQLYDGMIEYHNIDDDGVVREIDADAMTLHGDFDSYTGDVINYVPPQKAGKIAAISGLTDNTGWCPVDHKTFESTLVPNVHVIGDAAEASPMSKSGFSASTQAKVCAAAIAALLSGARPGTPKFINTCYSLAGPDYGLSVASVYGLVDGKITKVKGSGGLSPSGAGASHYQREAQYAKGWYKSIVQDIWG